MTGALEEKSASLEKQEQMRGEAKALEAQVMHQAERNKSDVDRLKYLEDCLSKLHEQQQDSLATLRKENIACAQAQTELKTTLARVKEAEREADTLRTAIAERKSQVAEEESREQARMDHSFRKDESAPSWNTDATATVLHEAHAQITALRSQIRLAQREQDEVSAKHQTSPQVLELDKWKKMVNELKKELYAKGLTDEQIEDAMKNGETEFEDAPTKRQSSAVGQTMKSSDLKLRRQLLADIFRPRRTRVIFGKKYEKRKRAVYRRSIEKFADEVEQHANVLSLSMQQDPLGPFEAVCRSISAAGSRPFRFQMARLRAERRHLQIMRRRTKASCAAIKWKYTRRYDNLKRQAGEKESEMLSEAQRLESEVNQLMFQIEEQSGSETSLALIQKYFVGQVAWLQQQIASYDADIAEVERLAGPSSKLTAAGTADLLEETMLRKRNARAARYAQVHQALVNIEKDIRLEERRQKNTQNAPHVRWTASGDAADADVQTDDSGFICVEKLFEENMSIQNKLDADVTVMTMYEDTVLIRLQPDGLAGNSIYSFHHVSAINFPDEEATKGTKEIEDEVDIGRRTKVSKDTGAAIAKMVDVEWKGEKEMRVVLLNQEEDGDNVFGCSPTLEVGCLYNDQEILRLSVFIGMDVPVLATLMQCRKLKYGMQFLHVRIYQPLAKWARYSTINMRDFCRRLGLTGLQQIVEIGHNPESMARFREYVEEIFGESLTAVTKPLHVLSECTNFCCHNKLLVGKQLDSEMSLICRERGAHDRSVRKHTKKLRDEGSEIYLRSAFPKVQIEVDRQGTIKLDAIMEDFAARVKLPEPKSRRRMSRGSDLIRGSHMGSFIATNDLTQIKDADSSKRLEDAPSGITESGSGGNATEPTPTEQ
jgi:hypothetical protein